LCAEFRHQYGAFIQVCDPAREEGERLAIHVVRLPGGAAAVHEADNPSLDDDRTQGVRGLEC
jgi:hypothetical protein